MASVPIYTAWRGASSGSMLRQQRLDASAEIGSVVSHMAIARRRLVLAGPAWR